MRTYANGDFFNKLLTDLQKVIIYTKVVSGHGNRSEEANFTSTDKIYLLNAKEVWNGNSYDTAINNTRQLDYYVAKGVTTSSYSNAIKQYIGSKAYWWLRSAGSDGSGSFLFVSSDGNWNFSHATDNIGFAPRFPYWLVPFEKNNF